MGIVGCYSIHLYCDHPSHVWWECRHNGDEYGGKDEATCLREARRAGWKIVKRKGYTSGRNGAGESHCPVCVKRSRK